MKFISISRQSSQDEPHLQLQVRPCRRGGTCGQSSSSRTCWLSTDKRVRTTREKKGFEYVSRHLDWPTGVVSCKLGSLMGVSNRIPSGLTAIVCAPPRMLVNPGCGTAVCVRLTPIFAIRYKRCPAMPSGAVARGFLRGRCCCF